MVTIFTVGILLILYSLLARKNYRTAIAFAFIFLIMGFQSGVEGDITRYMETYNHAANTGVVDGRTIDTEPVIPYMMRIFGFVFPWWMYLAIISLFQCAILVIFIERYSPTKYKYLAAILFYFTFNMMLMQMMALRQAFAIEMMILAFLLIDRNRIGIAISCGIIAFFAHNSAIALVPFAILFYLVRKRKVTLKFGQSDIFPFIMVGIYLAVYVVKVVVLNDYLVALAMLDDEFRLASYFEGKDMDQQFDISWLIVLYDAVIVFLVSWYFKIAESKMRVFCAMSILAAFGDMLLFGLGALPRINMYFIIFNLVVYPAIALRIRQKYGTLATMAFIVALIGYAVKTSLPYITTVEESHFGSYNLLFFS